MMKVISNLEEKSLNLEIDTDWIESTYSDDDQDSEIKSICEDISMKMDQLYLESKKRRFILKEIANYIK